MLRIVNAANDSSAVLIEVDGIYYKVDIYWPQDIASGDVVAPPTGTQLVWPYDSLEAAMKWGPWAEGIDFDEERPAAPESYALLNRLFDDYKAGRGYQP